jgi:hypothetical protein
LQIQTVRLARVFDIQFNPRSTASNRCTQFSFETETGRRCLSVELPGQPRLVAGDTVTAVLGQADNWQTLRGWRNLSNGEFVVRGDLGAIGWLYMIAVSCVALLLWSNATTSNGRTMSGLFLTLCGFVVAALLQQQWQAWRVRRLLENL